MIELFMRGINELLRNYQPVHSLHWICCGVYSERWEVMSKARINFEHFARLCQGQQLKAVRVNGNHWQIKGGLRIVNVYPYSIKGPSFYIQGMSKGRKGSPLKAIQAAKKIPEQNRCHERSNPKVIRRVRESLWHSQKGLCKWCGHYVLEHEATLDHIVALSKGGGNGLDNLCMACEHCNLKRGNNCTAEELMKGGE